MTFDADAEFWDELSGFDLELADLINQHPNCPIEMLADTMTDPDTGDIFDTIERIEASLPKIGHLLEEQTEDCWA